MNLDANGADSATEVRAVLASDLPDVAKLARLYGAVTRRIQERAQHDVELAHALGDREGKIRHQIRLEMIKTARSVFRGLHRQVTGTEAWDESPGC